MTKYKSARIIDGRRRTVIVDETETETKIVNRRPTKEELIGLEEGPYKRQCKIKRTSQSYTKDQLLKYLRQFYEENGRVPAAKDFSNNPEYPHFVTYQKYFGSWDKAMELADLLDKRKRRCWYTDEELLEYLKQFHKENERPPTETDFRNDHKYPSLGTYIRYFGSWNKALKFAELDINYFTNITDDELLKYLMQFYEYTGRTPVENDFVNNSKYPGYGIYQRRFGSFQKALKLVGLDFDTVARNGIKENSRQKGRLFEIYILEHFENKSKDLSGENQNNPCDGICPKGHIYEVKSSKLYDNRYYTFNTRNKFREEIEYYYLGGFNPDWTMPEHVWRVPGEIVEKDYFIVGLNSDYMYNMENMKEYETTEKFKHIDILK